MKLVLHPRTKQALERYINRPAHALLLSGSQGLGKQSIAEFIAESLQLQVITIAVLEDKSSISIEQIRELYQMTQTGTPLCIIIRDAHAMSSEAQNAFLKLLEEPPKDTIFVLTTASLSLLLSTIISRSQVIEIIPPTTTDINSYIQSKASQLSEQDSKLLLHTATNLPGNITSLLDNQVNLEQHILQVSEAKQFYIGTTYQRHCLVIEHGFDKIWIQQLLDILVVIIRSLIKTKSTAVYERNRLIQQSSLIEATQKILFSNNGNSKIHMTRLISEL